MREREIELIASLAEGSLDDESEARALIASSPEAREEYEAHLLAIETLRGASPEVMSDVERAALHRDVWTNLRAKPASGRRSLPWFYRWTVAAAGLLVVVGSVAVLNGLGALGGDDSTETVAQLADRAVATTAAGETGGADEMAGGSEAPAAAPESNGFAAGGADGAVAEQDLGGLTDEDIAYFADEAALVRDGDLTHLDGADLVVRSTDTASCLDQSGLEGYTAVGEITLARQIGGLEPGATLIVAVSENDDLANSAVVFVDTPACVVTYVNEPG